MFKNIFFIFLLFLFTSSANAKQIKITSDKLEIIRADNLSIFSGNVHALEGNLEIWSEKLIITSSDDEKIIEKVDALNNVKIFRDELYIEGNKAKYDPIMNTLIVFGEVKVQQNENFILCDEIVVDLKKSSSIMRGGSTNRVKALIVSKDVIK